MVDDMEGYVMVMWVIGAYCTTVAHGLSIGRSP